MLSPFNRMLRALNLPKGYGNEHFGKYTRVAVFLGFGGFPGATTQAGSYVVWTCTEPRIPGPCRELSWCFDLWVGSVLTCDHNVVHPKVGVVGVLKRPARVSRSLFRVPGGWIR